MITLAGYGQKEFSWEREWRHRGDMPFLANQVVAVLAPAEDHAQLRSEIAGLSTSWH